MDDWVHVFDFDGTLYLTSECVYVWSPRGDIKIDGKSCFRLHSSEYCITNLCNDEYVNEASFQNFRSVNWNKAIEIIPVLNIFHNQSSKKILSARPQVVESQIKSRIHGEFEFIGLGDGNPYSKIDFMKKIDSEKIIYEDSISVIDLCRKNSIKCCHVSQESGKTSLIYYI